MRISQSKNISQLFCVLGIFVTSNFDLLGMILILTSYAALGLILVLLLLFSEEWGKSSRIARRNIARLIQLSLKTIFTKPAFPLTEANSWLLSLRLALGSNLFLWIATLSLLRHSVDHLSGWFWSWQVVNALVTIIVWTMRPLKFSALDAYGCYKDLQKILIFGLMTTTACLIAVNTNVNPGGVLVQQSIVRLQVFNSWNIYANPIGTIAACLILYLYTVTFNALQPRQRQFELNYAHYLTKEEPALSATLELVRGFWQLNLITLFVIVFLGGNRGLLAYFLQDYPVNLNLVRLIVKVLFVGLVIHVWRQRQIELATKQWLHFFLKRLLPAMAGVLWLALLFN